MGYSHLVGHLLLTQGGTTVQLVMKAGIFYS